MDCAGLEQQRAATLANLHVVDWRTVLSGRGEELIDLARTTVVRRILD